MQKTKKRFNFDVMRIKPKTIYGAIISLTAYSLAWAFFGWKLPLIILLAIWGNNIERTFKDE